MLEMPQMVQTWKEVCCIISRVSFTFLMLYAERTWSWMEEMAEISWTSWGVRLYLCLRYICTNIKTDMECTAGVGSILLLVYTNSTRIYENVRSFEHSMHSLKFWCAWYWKAGLDVTALRFLDGKDYKSSTRGALETAVSSHGE